MGNRLKGKIAIVTGSGQGVGKGVAIALAREGCKVMTNNRAPGGLSQKKYSPEMMPKEDWEAFIKLKGDAQDTADAIIAEGNEAVAFFGDVSDWATAENMIKLAVDTYGGIDIIVNNAAGLGMGGIEALTEEAWDSMFLSRAKGAFNLMHFALPYMKEKGYGRVINFASDAWVGLVDNDAYSASTASMVGLTYAASKELYRYGITVNCICPQGASPTHAVEYKKMVRRVEQMTGQAPDPKILEMVEADHGPSTGLGPILTVLCEEDGSWINGAVLSAKSSGKTALYTYPKLVNQIFKGYGADWPYEEFKADVKNTLLATEYENLALNQGWQAKK